MGKITFTMLMSALERNYGTDDYGMFSSISRIPPALGRHDDDYSFLAGLKVLDIGCGNCEGKDGSSDRSRQFEPWVCRALLECGAEPVGIDIGKNPSQKFQTHQKDILLKGGRDFLESSSFDIAHCYLLLPPNSSPSLKKAVVEKISYAAWYQKLKAHVPKEGKEIIGYVESKCEGDGGKAWSYLWGKQEDLNPLLAKAILEKEVMPEIFRQITRILTEDSYFFCEDSVYQKINGELVEKKKAE